MRALKHRSKPLQIWDKKGESAGLAHGTPRPDLADVALRVTRRRRPHRSQPLWRRGAVVFAVRNGHIKRITDADIQSSVLEIAGTNVSTTYVTCPADPKKTLGIKLPFLVMIIKNVSLVGIPRVAALRAGCVLVAQPLVPRSPVG